MNMLFGDIARTRAPAPPRDDPVAAPLARAAAAIARLDQALGSHPLTPAILYRARLEAVRRAAAVDGQAIDPWHLAAVLEGLRLRMDPYLRIIDRGAIFEAARHALDQYQWLVSPDFDQEGDVQAAERGFAAAPGATPLIAAGRGFHAWLDQGGDRRAGRTALVRFWRQHHLLRVSFPLIGAASLRAEGSWAFGDWLPAFLEALAGEAEHGLQLLMTLEHAWFAARAKVADRRTTSRAGVAIDVMAAAPLDSATSLAKTLGMAVQNAAALLDRFCRDGIAIEVSHRAKRRLYGLTDLAPLRDGVARPRRTEPGRGRGRPPNLAVESEWIEPPLPPLTPIERSNFDYSGLEATMAFVDEAIHGARRFFATLPQAARGRTAEGLGVAAAAPPESESTSVEPGIVV